MNLFLAGTGSPINWLGGDDMNLFLAESGGVWNAYFKGEYKMDLYLAGDKKARYIKKNNEVGERMNLFLAGSESRAEMLERCESDCTSTKQGVFHKEKSGLKGGLFKGTNILQSFYYCNDFTEKVIIPQCKRFMLDSGAFTFFSSGEKVDWENYIKRYANFINRNKVELFFELDIDKLIGYEKVLYYRKMLEHLTGKKCIPVWHKSRGLEEFKKMCKEYDYVAIGGIVTKEITQKEYKFFPQLIKIAHENGAKIHGLGFTNLKGLTQYHFDSVDSTSWVSGNRFGAVYKFNGKTMIKFDKKQGQRLADSKAVAIHNFKEWVKFAEYAEKYL